MSGARDLELAIYTPLPAGPEVEAKPPEQQSFSPKPLQLDYLVPKVPFQANIYESPLAACFHEFYSCQPSESSLRVTRWGKAVYNATSCHASALVSASFQCCGNKDAFYNKYSFKDTACFMLFCCTVGMPTCAVQTPIVAASSIAGAVTDVACCVATCRCPQESDRYTDYDVITQIKTALENKDLRTFTNIFTAETTTSKIRDEIVSKFREGVVQVVVEYKNTDVTTREKAQLLLYIHERGHRASLIGFGGQYYPRYFTDYLHITSILENKSADSHTLLAIILHLSDAKNYYKNHDLIGICTALVKTYDSDDSDLSTCPQARAKAEILKKYHLDAEFTPDMFEDDKFYLRRFKDVAEKSQRKEMITKAIGTFGLFMADPVVEIIDSYRATAKSLKI